MNNNYKRKQDCCSSKGETIVMNQKNRPKRMCIEDKRSNMAKFPSECLKHILSFLTYAKLTQIRRVSVAFNATCIKVLDEGLKELEGRLEREVERAERRNVLCPINLGSSCEMVSFLHSLRQAFNNCAITYTFYIGYFLPGKLLDDVNYMLNGFNSWPMLPYIPENGWDQKPHPLLAPILTHCKRVTFHGHVYGEGKDVELERVDSEQLKLTKQYNMMKVKRNLLKTRRRKMECGIETNRELAKLISKFNHSVLELTLRAKTMDGAVDGVLKKTMDTLNEEENGRSNCFSPPLKGTNAVTAGLKQRPNLATLPASCIGAIVSYFSCHQIAQLRIVCKLFNEAGKTQLNREFKKVKMQLELKIKFMDADMCRGFQIYDRQTSILKDIGSFLRLCQQNYRWHLGTNSYFIAGKMLDEAKVVYNKVCQLYDDEDEDDDLYYEYESKPHYKLFPLMELVHKARAHYKFIVAPLHFPSAQKPIFVLNFVTTGDTSAIVFENENQLKLEELNKLIEEADMKIKKQNDTHRKFLRIISTLKKKIYILNNEICEKFNVLK